MAAFSVLAKLFSESKYLKSAQVTAAEDPDEVLRQRISRSRAQDDKPRSQSLLQVKLFPRMRSVKSTIPERLQESN